MNENKPAASPIDTTTIRRWCRHGDGDYDRWEAIKSLCDAYDKRQEILRELVEADTKANSFCTFDCNSNCPHCMKQLNTLTKAKVLLND